MSTFSGLNTAYTGLVAAQTGLNVVGQNIANATTDGYTRQRVTTSAVVAPPSTTSFSTGVGQGVSVDGIARLGNSFADAMVRTATASSGYWGVRSSAMTTLETGLQEPGTNGLSTGLQNFWSAWQVFSNSADTPASASVLLAQAGSLTGQIASGYQQVDQQWSGVRSNADTQVAALNDAASQVAGLNGLIRSTLATGGSANELIDKRNTLTTQIANLAGGTVRDRGDGTVDVLIGGNQLVSGTTANTVKLAGSYLMSGASGAPVQLEWSSSPGSAIALDGGEIGGSVAMLAAANSTGDGGPIAEAAASYNAFATALATQVNAVHETGVVGGTTGHDFFAIDSSKPAALGLSVIPTDSTGIANGAVGAGAYDGSVADAISQLGTGSTSPDTIWSGIVTGIGAASQVASQQSTLSDLSTTSATNAQLSNSAVSLDEENVNMITFQHAYQGAARVMTTLDQMLDTLINHTGTVGL
ncbi:MAG: flagellar hook-associated protein 1 [Microbacteriaceae bacterium]|nr:flagellar biosynthesis protein FlgK [Microbacteriaceae bacterium]MDQ1549630.1 flagellar hook-associated protein 1 [Microbacteriaceae bacterium]MDQ1554101.1 flagellar hook-associated protein 1 [Microbacteriaceae bacterium]MDQ1578593.1 flagellar hook-associated protein 1 [Microbacteriaceae bacterium]